jgi:hypothetical protein
LPRNRPARGRGAKIHGPRLHRPAFFTSLSNLVLLAPHLGVVMALFATLPYGKFAHGVLRCAALLKWAIEKRQPSRLQLGGNYLNFTAK